MSSEFVKHMVVCRPWSLEVYGEHIRNLLVALQHVLHLGMYGFGSADNVIFVQQHEEDMKDAFDLHGHCALPFAVDY